MNYNAKNLDIESVLSLLPEKHKARISDYKSSGEFFANGNFNYDAQKPLKLDAKFGINKATIKYSPKNTQLDNVSLSGELLVDGNKTSLDLSKINANLNGDNFAGRFFISDFNNPYIDVSANGVFNLLQINSFWPMDTLEKLEGVLKFNGAVKGKINDLKERAFSEQISIQLFAEVSGFKAKFKNDTKELSVENCKIKAQERNVEVENLKLLRGNSDVDLTGTIPGFFNFIFDSKSPLIINGKLVSKNLDIEDFIYSKTSNSSQSSEFNIPANIGLNLDANINHFVFNKFDATNITGNFELKNQKAMLSEMTFETMEGTASANAYADASGKNLEVSMQAQIKNININKMFLQLNNFGQSTLTDKNVNGFVTADIDFSGSWDKNLNSILNSIVANAELNIERGELNDFKPLESLSKFVDLKELQRIKFASLSSSLHIKNKKTFIPQTVLKNSALNIEFNGTHDFDNNIDYHIRLLISELLAKKRKQTSDEFGPLENDPENKRSAFILMTGNVDDIKIKYDKQGLKQKIKEDIKQEKQNLKQILKEEFGGFKNDTAKTKPGVKANQKFELEKPNNKIDKKPLEPKKKEEDDDDF